MTKSNWLKMMAATLGAGGILVSSLRPLDAAPPGLERREVLRRIVWAHLGITPAQRKQIREVLRAERDDLLELASRLHLAREALRTVVRQEDATEEMVRGAAAELAVVQSDVAVKRHELILQLRPVLTDEQLEYLDAAQDQLEWFFTEVLEEMSEGRRLRE